MKKEKQDKIKELEVIIEQEKSAKLMALADFQNYKKRLENEKNDYRVFATKLIVGQMMQIIDDFNRAQKDIEDKLKDTKVSKEVLDSLKMISDKISFMITQNGFEEIKINIGDKFNPEYMEALSIAPVKESMQDNTILHIDQKAYKHIESGIVFRSAKVIIGKFNK